MTQKPHPERVNASVGRQVLLVARNRQASWSDYIVAHYRATGQLAPGCDARDWFAWYDKEKGVKG